MVSWQGGKTQWNMSGDHGRIPMRSHVENIKAVVLRSGRGRAAVQMWSIACKGHYDFLLFFLFLIKGYETVGGLRSPWQLLGIIETLCVSFLWGCLSQEYPSECRICTNTVKEAPSSEKGHISEKNRCFSSKKQNKQTNKKYCPTYIISYELSPREEIILEHLLKDKSVCVPTTPKIFQSTGIPFLVIWVKGRNNNRAEADGKSWGSCPCCTYSDTQCINYPFQVQVFSRLLSSSQHVPSLDTSQKSIVFEFSKAN